MHENGDMTMNIKIQKMLALFLPSLLMLGASTAVFAQNTPGYNNKIPDTILTPDTVETRIGTLKFFDGQPDADTVQMVYDNLDFLREAWRPSSTGCRPPRSI